MGTENTWPCSIPPIGTLTLNCDDPNCTGISYPSGSVAGAVICIIDCPETVGRELTSGRLMKPSAIVTSSAKGLSSSSLLGMYA